MLSQKVKRLLHLGFEYDAFADYRAEINSSNLLSLRNLTLTGTVIPAVILIVSLVPDSPLVSMRLGYIIVLIAMGLTLTLSYTLLKTHPQFMPLVWSFLYIFIYLGGTLISTILLLDSNAVTMIVFVVVVPLFCLERPILIYSITGVMSLVFLVITNLYKDPNIARTDSINICVFYFCGVIAYYQTARAKLRDITSRAQLRLQRDTDSLTGLHNRLFCENVVKTYIESHSEPALFMMLDLDNFKSVNDTLGHDVGDSVLQAVAKLLLHTFRANDIIGRIGGDEFIIFLPSCGLTELMLQKIQGLIRNVAEIPIGDRDPIHIGASIGISCYPNEGDSFLSLYKCSDLALYDAKKNGKGRFVIYNKEETAKYPGHTVYRSENI